MFSSQYIFNSFLDCYTYLISSLVMLFLDKSITGTVLMVMELVLEI